MQPTITYIPLLLLTAINRGPVETGNIFYIHIPRSCNLHNVQIKFPCFQKNKSCRTTYLKDESSVTDQLYFPNHCYNNSPIPQMVKPQSFNIH